MKRGEKRNAGQKKGAALAEWVCWCCMHWATITVINTGSQSPLHWLSNQGPGSDDGANLDQYYVELVQVYTVFRRVCVGGHVDDQVRQDLPDAFPLILWQNVPFGLHSFFKDLRAWLP